MNTVFRTLFFTLSLSGTVFLAAPIAQAQDNGTPAEDKSKREDYKSPASPELLAQQNPASRTVSAPTSSASTTKPSSSRSSTKTTTSKHTPREMAF